MLIKKPSFSRLPFYVNAKANLERETELINEEGTAYKQYIRYAQDISVSFQLAQGRFISSEVKQGDFGDSDRDIAYVCKLRTKDISALDVKAGNRIVITEDIINDSVNLPYPNGGKVLQIRNIHSNGFHIEVRCTPVTS